jgi:hypothetical protein
MKYIWGLNADMHAVRILLDWDLAIVYSLAETIFYGPRFIR